MPPTTLNSEEPFLVMVMYPIFASLLCGLLGVWALSKTGA